MGGHLLVCSCCVDQIVRIKPAVWRSPPTAPFCPSPVQTDPICHSLVQSATVLGLNHRSAAYCCTSAALGCVLACLVLFWAALDWIGCNGTGKPSPVAAQATRYKRCLARCKATLQAPLHKR